MHMPFAVQKPQLLFGVHVAHVLPSELHGSLPIATPASIAATPDG